MEIEFLVTSKSDGLAQTYRVPMEDRVVLGRSLESAVPLDGPAVSREHLAFDRNGGTILVTDLSSHGTAVNGQALARGRPVPVRENDGIEIPGFEIRFRLIQPAAPPPPTTTAPTAPVKPPAPAPQPATRLTPVRRFASSLSGLEKFSLAVVLAALGLVLAYWLSR